MRLTITDHGGLTPAPQFFQGMSVYARIAPGSCFSLSRLCNSSGACAAGARGSGRVRLCNASMCRSASTSACSKLWEYDSAAIVQAVFFHWQHARASVSPDRTGRVHVVVNSKRFGCVDAHSAGRGGAPSPALVALTSAGSRLAPVIAAVLLC